MGRSWCERGSRGLGCSGDLGVVGVWGDGRYGKGPRDGGGLGCGGGEEFRG